MTAQVAVLNTQGIALASDSAVTVTSGNRASRSYPSADKIFPIKDVALAVMHSGAASLWGVPWQILIEMWSQDRRSAERSSMEDYALEFVKWLQAQAAVVSQANQDEFVLWMFRDMLLFLRGRVMDDLGEAGLAVSPGLADDDARPIVDKLTEELIERLTEADAYDRMDDFDGRPIARRLRDELQEGFEWVFDDVQKTALLENSIELIASLLVNKVEPFQRDAELAFVGYGAEDFFPSMYRMTVSGVVGNIARVYKVSISAVDAESRASINPLGMTAPIHLFLRGVSPEYRNLAHSVLDGLSSLEVDQESTAVVDAVAEAHATLNAEFDSLEWRSFLSPMLDVVETLPVSEALRLADSLVGLASLHGLIHGESSVGGPVDLARITKQRGFEWVRSKHSVGDV